jgi:UDP-glucose 6-dehydrogenase
MSLSTMNLDEVKDVQSIGIIGAGVVGSAMIRLYSEYVPIIKVYDTNAKRSTTKNLCELFGCDLIFICLPTPRKEEGGGLETKAISSTIRELITSKHILGYHQKLNIVIRSTVPVDYCRKLIEEYGDEIDLVHYPEFGTARCMEIDFQFTNRHVIGLNQVKDGNILVDSECYDQLIKLITHRFGIIVTIGVFGYEETALIKLATNAFFGVKIAFFNQLKLLTSTIKNCDFDLIVEMMRNDLRIGKDHTQVPGPDGKIGFGGTCLPKDLEEYSKFMMMNELDTENDYLVCRAADNFNYSIRPSAYEGDDKEDDDGDDQSE